MVFKSTKKFVQLFVSVFILLALQACNHDETVSYQFDYLSDLSQVYQGKSTFTIAVTDKDSGLPLAGLDLAVNPVMTMDSGMVHNTPVESVTDNGDGTYEATVYYLMPSTMGMMSGSWDLNVSVDDQVAHFYPVVKMSMGDTAMAKLRGQSAGTDKIPGMLADESRYYFVFKNTVMGSNGNHTFKFFLAARESLMSHPAVSTNTTLNAGTSYELLVSETDAVDVSTDGGVSWSAATDNGNGNWSLTGIPDLTDGVQAPINVRLTIQGEQKTINEAVPAGDGTNDYATLLITPGMMM